MKSSADAKKPARRAWWGGGVVRWWATAYLMAGTPAQIRAANATMTRAEAPPHSNNSLGVPVQLFGRPIGFADT